MNKFLDSELRIARLGRALKIVDKSTELGKSMYRALRLGKDWRI
jgi:hypothetical protein